jgi:hypothetical protein
MSAWRVRPASGAPPARAAARLLARLLLLLAVLATGACALRVPPPAAPESPEAACRCLLADLDRAVVQAGVGHAASRPVAGFPSLRTDRFLAALAGRLDSPAAREAWVRRQASLGLEARRLEVAALEAGALGTRLQGREAATGLLPEVERCQALLLAADRQRPDFHQRLVEAQTPFPDGYALWRRALGLYPLAAPPVAYVSHRAYDTLRQRHRTPEAALPVRGRLLEYVPPPAAAAPDALRTWFAPAHRDALGLPRLGADEVQALAETFAPRITQDTAAAYDRIGAVAWGPDGQPRVDPERPVVYFYLSHAFHQGRPALQLNYVFWYSRRDGPEVPWFERGALDGLTLRLHLDPAGAPVLADVMHTCGCYHILLPDWRRTAGYTSGPFGLMPLVPAWLPLEFPARPLRLRVSSGWHQVDRVAAGAGPAAATVAYSLQPYARLEALPREGAPPRSLFDPRGIAVGSQRPENLIFFSMGIPDLGSMRQRGHHATQLVGRETFDDPHLLDRYFRFREGPPRGPEEAAP